MTPPLSDDLKELIVTWYMEDGLTMDEIRRRARCSLGAVHKIIENYRCFGSVNHPLSHRSGRPFNLSEEDEHYLEEIVISNPSLYLDEMQEKMAEVLGCDISLASISRALARMRITRKHVQKAALERNEELRNVWEAHMAQYTDPNLFVFIDESAVDNKTFQRGHGWSAMGEDCVRPMTFLRGVRHSILPALTVDGIIALDIIEGSVNRDLFLHFLRTKLAPQLNPYPGKSSIVIMDNCSIHHDEDIRRLIEDECGAKLIYLPPYSPDFNPIEEAFSAIKSVLRRHEKHFQSANQLPWLIHQASASITRNDVLGWFSDCGYL